VIRRRAVALVFVVGALVALDAAPAFAHAVLVGTDPVSGANLNRAPKTVTLQFGETVEASLGAIRVFDQRGNRLDVGAPFHPGAGHEVSAHLPSLRAGSYVVTWRVTSGDSHPVRGAFTFRIGGTAAGRNVNDLLSRLLTQQGGSTTVGVVFGFVRFVVFASLAILVGAVALVATVWPEGRMSRRASRIVWGAWIAALAATVAAYALQGAYAAGLPLSHALQLNELRGVWHTRFGHVSVLRCALLVASAVVLRPLFGRRPATEYPLPVWWPPAAAALGLALVATPGLAGHATAGRWRGLALPADAVHVGAMAVWLGGLVVLAACVLPVRDPLPLRKVVPRFSRLALVCIVTIVGTGAFQAWRQIGTIHSLMSTDYGRTLLVKLSGVAVILVAAGFSRDVVRRRFRRPYGTAAIAVRPVLVGGGHSDTPTTTPPADDADGEWTDDDEERFEVRRLRQAVGVEVVVGLLVLAVTAVLVNAPPAYNVEHGPFLKTVLAQGHYYDLIVSPAKSGPNDVHVTAVTKGGGPADVLSYSVTFSEPGKDIAPIKVPLLRLGPGHYASYAFQLPFTGAWQMSVRALISDTEENTFTVKIPIR
jgi:copper transport protein